MKAIAQLFCALLCLFSSLIFAETLTGKCIRVADGDTCTLLVGKEEYQIRFDGIDAPENKQKFGQESKEYLAKRILNKKIRVETKSRDDYDRVLGSVYLGKENINLTLIQEGLAWDYAQHNAGPEYTAAQQNARAKKRGLWKQGSPMPPWEFRYPKAHQKSQAEEQTVKIDPTQFKYWISNSGKTHNKSCEHFLSNPGSGTYTNTPSPQNAGCCGGTKPKRR